MFFGKKKLLGLDIGSSHIKVAELDINRRGAKLLSFNIIPTPKDAVAANDIIDPERLSQSVQELVMGLRTRRKHVASGLWGTSVIVKRVSIPKMEESLIAEQIRWEAEQYVPYDVNEVNLAYHVVSKGKSDTMDILLIAALQEFVLKCAELIEVAGLNCSVLDVGGIALANCFEHNYGRVSGTVGLLNIGASVTNFVVIENGEVIFCRDIAVGGGTYTSEIQKTLGMTFAEAENLKLSAATGQPAPDEVVQVIQSTHDVVREEISASIDFFRNTSTGHDIESFFISGGGSKMRGLKENLSRSVRLQVLDVFQNITTDQKKISSSYLDDIRDFAAIAMGLGLRQVGDA